MVGLFQVSIQQYAFDTAQALYVHEFRLIVDLCAHVRLHVGTLHTQGICLYLCSQAPTLPYTDMEIYECLSLKEFEPFRYQRRYHIQIPTCLHSRKHLFAHIHSCVGSFILQACFH